VTLLSVASVTKLSAAMRSVVPLVPGEIVEAAARPLIVEFMADSSILTIRADRIAHVAGKIVVAGGSGEVGHRGSPRVRRRSVSKRARRAPQPTRTRALLRNSSRNRPLLGRRTCVGIIVPMQCCNLPEIIIQNGKRYAIIVYMHAKSISGFVK